MASVAATATSSRHCCSSLREGSQFFITFAPCKALDGKHVVFGKVVDGWSVLDKVEAVAAPGGVSEEPAVPVVVADCGLL